MRRLYRALGYWAFWPALYVLGGYLLCAMALGVGVTKTLTVAFLLTCAHACYLLDRVKISDQRQDPADALALPERAMIFARHAARIRALLVVELLLSAALGWTLHPLLAAVPLTALIIVHLYAGRKATPGSPRFKDLPAIKAFVIASGHLALIGAVLWEANPELHEQLQWRHGLGLLGFWLIVSGDAVLCDIDDEPSDRVYQTRSLPVLLGVNRAWIAAACMLASGSALLLTAPGGRPGAGMGLTQISALLVLTTLASRRITNHRDFVDARLLPIVLLGLLAERLS